MEKVILVTVALKHNRDNWRIEDTAGELEELARTSGVEVKDHSMFVVEKPTANLFIGQGKAQEIAFLCQEYEVDAVIMSQDLSGTQQRNLENIFGCKTIDRTQLILDIFARHAKSPEGKMQVELAQLEYLLPRLTGKGVVLSRLGGGIGTRGPGEQKLEVDRRRIRKRIDKLKDDLRQHALHRQTVRKRRKENAMPQVALVGYTNAGKSSLLNALTEAGQVVSDGLFTTLDPLAKKIILPNKETIVLSDTVGFLHNLPHHVIEAFKATLEEVIDADLLIHVLDVNHPRVYEHSKSVFKVLHELKSHDKPTITALNKIDLLEDKTWLRQLEHDFDNAIAISAMTKENLDALLEKIQSFFSERMVRLEVMISHKRMDLVDLFYRNGKVEQIEYLPKGIKVNLSLPRVLAQQLQAKRDIEPIS
ncbi:MAG: GTPase HflX [Candidatus Omnitrophica bacterium]|nr:GTPase HflX [Candidatus Omnitrophota bacterium]